MAIKFLAAKKLLSENDLPMEANTFFNGLILAGLMEKASYLSTTGSGEIKHYLRLVASGLTLGENVANSFHKIKTEPRFKRDSFPDAYLTPKIVQRHFYSRPALLHKSSPAPQ